MYVYAILHTQQCISIFVDTLLLQRDLSSDLCFELMTKLSLENGKDSTKTQAKYLSISEVVTNTEISYPHYSCPTVTFSSVCIKAI